MSFRHVLFKHLGGDDGRDPGIVALLTWAMEYVDVDTLHVEGLTQEMFVTLCKHGYVSVE